MGNRVYLLLDVVNGMAEQVAQVLRESPGVSSAEIIEDPPDVIVVVEATKQQRLAKYTSDVLALVERLIEDLHLLPVRNRLDDKET
jgi:hypothetical protein